MMADPDSNLPTTTVLDIETGVPLKAAADTATLCWSNIKVDVVDSKGNPRTLLKGVSGYVEPSHMLAVMGPSGAGKSTLLDTLAGRLAKNAKRTGSILLNGHESTLSYGKSAYVTQDEELIGTLTVKETLMYTALLRLASATPYREKEGVVNAVIAELGLGVCENTYIGNWHLRGISGGQRRRVAIGCELILRPSLLFLDEPTSGLDAAAAFYCMNVIRKLASHGRTIIATIHQPSSETYALFDQLCLLSDGHAVYFGKADEAEDFFNSVGLGCPAHRNPADHFLAVINRDFQVEGAGAALGIGDIDKNIETLTGAYRDGARKQDVEAHIAALTKDRHEAFAGVQQRVNAFQQLSVLTGRTFKNNLRNIGLFWMRLGMYIVLCICLGTIYYNLNSSWPDVQARPALLFFVVAFLTFMSISGFPAFVADMLVFTRERLNGYYGVLTFTLANTFASIPFILLITVLSSVCLYFLAGLNDSGDRFPYFIIDLFLSLLVVESLMMTIAAVVPHFMMGIAAGAGLLGLYMIVCGFFKLTDALPKPVWLYPMHYIAFHTYAFSGFMNNEFRGTDGWCEPSPAGAVANCGFTGTQVLALYDIPNRNKWLDLVILLGMIILYRGTFFLMLKWREWSRR